MLDSETMRTVNASIAVGSWLMFLLFPFYKRDIKVLLLLLVFGIVFYSTQFYYGYTESGYMGHFLKWGADCVSGTLLGITLMKQKDYKLIHKILPWECLVLTPFMVHLTLSSAITAGQYKDEGGLNYQIIAYLMAIFYCYSLFYVFIYKAPKTIIVKSLLFAAMVVQAVTCAMSGGRGGLVLILVFTVYMAIYMVKEHKIKLWKMLLASLVVYVGFVYIAGRFGLSISEGFQRSSNFMNDEDRIIMWQSIWPYVVDNGYMGYGLGGDFYTFGFYTHNIFLDFVLETGIIGFVILASFFLWMFIRIYKFSLKNDIFVVIMIYFIYGFTINIFSGYWISTNTHWVTLGVALTSSLYYKYNHTTTKLRKRHLY